MEGLEKLETLKGGLRPVPDIFVEQVRLVADALERMVPPTSHADTGLGLPAGALEAIAAVRSVLNQPLPSDAGRGRSGGDRSG